MLSERAQRQVERLLDEADASIKVRDWSTVLASVQDVLTLDPENADALTYRVAAERALGSPPPPATPLPPAPARAEAPEAVTAGAEQRGEASGMRMAPSLVRALALRERIQP